MPYFICPNCKSRSIDHDRRESLTDPTAVGCHRCGFGFLFELMGREVVEALRLDGFQNGQDPVALSLEWGVRRLGELCELTAASGMRKQVTADIFPAYDDDGGLLLALTPR